jgi:GTP-binding protein Era
VSEPKGYRAGFIGLIGLPNSGKSTLMNALVGEKVSIVTAKPQTTRRRVMGLVTEKDFQAVIVDAPGIVGSTSGLNNFLKEEAIDVISQSDSLIAVLNIDERSGEALDSVLELVSKSGKPWVAVIHKTDLPLLHRPQILRDKLEKFGVKIVQGSSLSDPKGIRESLLALMPELLPENPKPLYEDDLYTLSSTKEISAEIVREKCFETLHQEIPFGLAVRILKFDEESPTLTRIFAEILVSKPNHRPIVIGKDGSQLKKIGTAARQELEKLMGNKVYLDLRVSAHKNWTKNSSTLKELGYVVEGH